MGKRLEECVEVGACHRASQCVSHHFSTTTAEQGRVYSDRGQVKMFETVYEYGTVTQQRSHLGWQQYIERIAYILI